HLSKDQGIELEAGDCVHISTPGGGGYGDARERDPESVLMDVRRGYYTPEEAERLFAVKLAGEPLAIDAEATAALRGGKIVEHEE
ncbi:MAG: methylhydantoinase, partial [Rhodospirillaceae bacterium]|nr:methylhydantoinase [Rhodospirillaceae bacterium]